MAGQVFEEMVPVANVAKLLRDRMRTTSLVYEMLVTTAGIGVAEEWIEALGWDRGPHRWGRAEGWYLYATPASERIARAKHPQATTAVLEFSRRGWEQAKAADTTAGWQF